MKNTLATLKNTISRRVKTKVINYELLKNSFSTYCNREPEIGLFLYVIEKMYKNRKLTGSGVSFDERIALIKAWAEYLERVSLIEYSIRNKVRINSNGFACHTSIQEAKKNSLKEIIERDSFLTSWLLKRPGKRVFLSHVPGYEKLQILEKKTGNETIFTKLPSCMDCHVYAAYVFGRYFQMETVSEYDDDKAKETIVLRALKQIMNCKVIKDSDYIQKFSKNPQSIEHKFYNLHLDKKKYIQNWTSLEIEMHELPSFEYSFELLENTLAKKTGFYVVRCKSKTAQNLWFGETKKSIVNFERLKLIHPNFLRENVNYDPHPFP